MNDSSPHAKKVGGFESEKAIFYTDFIKKWSWVRKIWTRMDPGSNPEKKTVREDITARGTQPRSQHLVNNQYDWTPLAHIFRETLQTLFVYDYPVKYRYYLLSSAQGFCR